MSVLQRGRLSRLGVTAAALAAIAAAGFTTGTASAASVSRTEAARVAAPAYTPPSRNLREGMKGADVKALQQRLAALRYDPGPIDGQFGSDALEAVWAFQEVNGLSVDGVIGPATKRALVHPRPYQARYPRAAGTRVEVNLKMGVLVFYRNHTIALISHVSSAGHYYYQCGSGTCYAETPTGEFRALYFVPGWQAGPLGSLYNPVYFNYSGYAIHGEYNSEVPVKPVSHGCVRIPMDIATWFYKDLTISETPGAGTEIWIYNQW